MTYRRDDADIEAVRALAAKALVGGDLLVERTAGGIDGGHAKLPIGGH